VTGKVWQRIVSCLFRDSPGKTRESRFKEKNMVSSRHDVGNRGKLMTPESSVKGTNGSVDILLQIVAIAWSVMLVLI
jgi:hypothetical protein